MHKLAEELYKAQDDASGGPDPSAGSDAGPTADDDDVVDADFTEEPPKNDRSESN